MAGQIWSSRVYEQYFTNSFSSLYRQHSSPTLFPTFMETTIRIPTYEWIINNKFIVTNTQIHDLRTNTIMMHSVICSLNNPSPLQTTEVWMVIQFCCYCWWEHRFLHNLFIQLSATQEKRYTWYIVSKAPCWSYPRFARKFGCISRHMSKRVWPFQFKSITWMLGFC